LLRRRAGGWNPVAPTNLQKNPLGENVEGLSLLTQRPPSLNARFEQTHSKISRRRLEECGDE